jgi:ankyrin repeat protein
MTGELISREYKIGPITIHSDAEFLVKITTATGVFSQHRETLLRAFAGSVIAQALEDDPTARELKLEQPFLTPSVLEIILNLAEGKEPETHEPKLQEASRYLNMPQLAVYSDPLQDYIDHKNPNSSCNRRVFAQALVTGRYPVMKYLLEKGLCPVFAEPYQPYLRPRTARVDVASDGQWPVEYAAKHGLMEAVQMLMAHPKVDLCAALLAASSSGHISVVQLLLTSTRLKPSDIRGNYYKVWHENHVEILRLLADWGLAFDFDHIVQYSVGQGYVDMLKLAKQKGGHWQQDMATACRLGFLEILGVCLDGYGGSVSFSGNCCLTAAILYKRDAIVETLLQHPQMDIKVGLNDEKGPLHTAIQYNNLLVIKMLFALPAVQANYNPKVVLKWAEGKGLPEIVAFLKSLSK